MRVDGATFSILGTSPSYLLSSQPLNVSEANVTNRVMTPTQITLTAEAGPMQVNVTFFNPVEVHPKFFNSLYPDSLSLFSQGIGSGNQYPSHTSPSRQCRLIVQLIRWKCIPTSAHVCEIVSQNCLVSPENCRLDYNNEPPRLRCYAVECHIKRWGHLPHCNILGTSLV